MEERDEEGRGGRMGVGRVDGLVDEKTDGHASA